MIATLTLMASKLSHSAGKAFLFLVVFFLAGCQIAPCHLEPTVIYLPKQEDISHLPSAFPPLSLEECKQEWAKELVIGQAFAKEFDLYRAITAYKRALILLPEELVERRLQITYDIILCYYLGLKYQEAILTFEQSELVEVNPLFPAFNNLLLTLYESYLITGQTDKAEAIMEFIEKGSPETARDLRLQNQIKEGNLCEVQTMLEEEEIPQKDDIQELLCQYEALKLSPPKARRLNALLPGAGYYYIGQKKAALTSFLINAIFAAATYQFFHKGYIAAGVITGSLELGWYVGGINGAGLEAQEYNNRLYSGLATKTLSNSSLFPILMFETSF